MDSTRCRQPLAQLRAPRIIVAPRPGAGSAPAGPPAGVTIRRAGGTAAGVGPHRPRDRREPLPGVLFRAELGRLAVAVAESGPDALGGRLPGGPLVLARPVSGALRVEQDGQNALVTPRTLVALDTSRPHHVVVPCRAHVVALLVPHALVGLNPEDTTGLTAATWSGTEAAAAPLFHLLAGIDRSIAQLAPATAEQLGSGITDLVGALLVRRLCRDTAAEAAELRRSLLLRIQSDARLNLSDPDLGPAGMARRHHVSLRYLHKVFHEQGLSPASWIRDERLARCRTDLLDPRLAHLTIAAIGERSGLRGASTFTRLFRERYGVTPGEFRRAAVHATATSPGAVAIVRTPAPVG